MQGGAIELVGYPPVTLAAGVQAPLRERPAEICFSPFNSGDCVSLVALTAT